MFFYFVSSSLCECQKLNAELGARHVYASVSSDKELCINITQFPFYLIFYNFPNDLIYREYYSRSPKRQTTRDVVFDATNYTSYRAIELPYGSITFSTNNTDTTEFSFTYATLPGYCQTGMYMNNAAKDEIILTPDGKGFYSLGNYDDKCFLFANPNDQTLRIKQTSMNPNDRVFLYTSYTESMTFSGNISKELVSGNSTHVPFIRVLTNRGDPPMRLSIELLTTGKNPKKPEMAIHIPRGRTVDCEHKIMWYSEELVIMLIACCFFAIVLILLIACKIANLRSRKSA